MDSIRRDQVARLLATGTSPAAAVLLVVCGGGGGSASPAATPTKGATGTVATRAVGEVGRVLVDSAGRALYTPDVEADGKIRCTGACTSFWQPLTVQSGTPTGGPGIPKLAVVTRPDGAKQVTANGRPLYTFTEDAPGKVTGNGFKDDFGGRHFVWSAVLAAGGPTGQGTGGKAEGC